MLLAGVRLYYNIACLEKKAKEEKAKTARIVELHGQRVKLTEEGETFDAVLSGKIKFAARKASPVAVGDYVKYIVKNGALASVEQVVDRKSFISRPSVEKDSQLQIIVSNVDRIIIVGSVAQPKFNPGIIERFLIIAFKENIQPVVVINKIDIESPDSLKPYIDAWRKISCQILLASAKTGEGIDGLSSIMQNGTSVFVGHSGVGKSSLLNRISPALELKTKKVSSYSNRGVHVTSRVSLYRIFKDGWVADTPGLKVLGFSDVDKKNLQDYFPEFLQYREDCRFIDCKHIKEPVCGIKKAVNSKDMLIAEFRYNSYKKIYESLKD